ncbi:hypothetical protein O181_015094 [Austropuccinia psidii MF-1]|uniref:Retrovirus-related Pol polyprotein from transposon TNT 1-94-like beta-barrel domain-containing protein n=1 Tax=Austropuccinia psidii MF-1 TaxID=1389203 RepID=A0A9Q3BZC4_9BASI|nr:hypothetical protein [Austropuccinia psidii MF-1]
MCTTHTKETCFAENPHLRPTYCTNKRKARSFQNPSAHLSTAQALVTGEDLKGNCEELIIDCGATHHMFNSRNLFSSFIKTLLTGVCTGDTNSSLFSKGLGTVNLLINNKILVLEECLLVPNLNCNSITLMRLCNKDLTISQSDSHFKLTIGKQVEMKGRIVNNLMRVEYSTPAAYITNISANL